MKNNQTVNNLANEIADSLSKEIQNEIDESIMLEILVKSGWTKVYLNFLHRVNDLDLVYEWLFENYTSDDWKRIGYYFVFKDPKHAEWFILRWS